MVAGILALTLTVVLEPAAAQLDAESRASATPEDVLARMNEAQREREYEGTLVYLHANRLATLRITRRIHNGVSKESLLALSGPIRAVARNEQGVTCMLSDSHSFSVPGQAAGAPLLRRVPLDFARIRENYLLHALGESRVAGRDTDVVGIVPRDDYRYGYRFFVDQETGLPLKIDLMDDQAEPLEQVMFTSILLHDASAQADSEPAAGLDNPAALVAPSASRALPERTAADGWILRRLPPGFVVVDKSAAPPAADVTEHLMVSDGIASASVYVEPAADGGLNGVKRMGAITAVGGPVDGYHVTVVGEVPEATARMLLDGLDAPAAVSAGLR